MSITMNKRCWQNFPSLEQAKFLVLESFTMQNFHLKHI